MSYRQIETHSEDARSLATASYIVNNVSGRKVQTEIRKKVVRMEHPDGRSVITYNGKSHDLRLKSNNAAKQRNNNIMLQGEVEVSEAVNLVGQDEEMNEVEVVTNPGVTKKMRMKSTAPKLLHV